MTADPAEIEHFAKDSAHWWDTDGPHGVLHRLNPLRMRYIRDQIARHYERNESDLKPLKGLNILDVGCGGGLVCEPLARMGAHVTGLDADEQAIDVARDHAAGEALTIEYRQGTVEDLRSTEQFDVVTALEIVEHIPDVPGFIRACTARCKPGGILIFSTLNRTPSSFLLGIVAAEHILRWVPHGTHQWKKFCRPSEISRALEGAGCHVADVQGYGFNPLAGQFELFYNDTRVNYFLTAHKDKNA